MGAKCNFGLLNISQGETDRAFFELSGAAGLAGTLTYDGSRKNH